MPSILLLYRDGTWREQRLEGQLRSLTWESSQPRMMLVGNSGRILRISGGDVTALESGTTQNLRGVSFHPSNGTALIVGNSGTILLWDQTEFHKITSPTTENLRAVGWDLDGEWALIVGNQGALLKYSNGIVRAIGNCRANLRNISLRPNTRTALIASNCFAEEFVPSPNLFGYDGDTDAVSALNEGRTDLIGVDWHPSGSFALAGGYDVVWHNGLIGKYENAAFTPVDFENRGVYPVTVAWNAQGNCAAIATATTQPGIAKGRIYFWEHEQLLQEYENQRFFFTKVSWSPFDGTLAALASTGARTYNC